MLVLTYNKISGNIFGSKHLQKKETIQGENIVTGTHTSACPGLIRTAIGRVNHPGHFAAAFRPRLAEWAGLRAGVYQRLHPDWGFGRCAGISRRREVIPESHPFFRQSY